MAPAVAMESMRGVIMTFLDSFLALLIGDQEDTQDKL